MPDLITTPFSAASTANDVLEDVDLTGKTFLVTGGASGIGRETSLALARHGAEVVAAVRDVDGARAALGDVGVGIVATHIDLADLNTVRHFVDEWTGKLDGIVANAGIMALPRRELSPAGWELQLATNYLGHFALIRGLHAALAAGDGGRVVVLSSTAHLRAEVDFDDPQYERRPYDRWNAYSQSKTADVLLARGLADRWASDGITANALMPGWITSRLQRHLDNETLRAMGAMDEAGNRIEQDFFKTAAQGAATSVLLVASPLVASATGRYFEDNQEAPTRESGEGHSTGVAKFALDPENAERLWELGERALN